VRRRKPPGGLRPEEAFVQEKRRHRGAPRRSGRGACRNDLDLASAQFLNGDGLRRGVSDDGARLAERNDLDGPHARETIAAALIITAGLWPIANPAAHITAMYAQDPALIRAHVHFEDRLQELLSALITGFLNTPTPKPPAFGR
jgi:hypothetical protein